MTQEEMNNLRPGDIVRSLARKTFVVTANYGNRITAVQSVDITNAVEWEKVRLPSQKKPSNALIDMNDQIAYKISVAQENLIPKKKPTNSANN